MLVPYTTIAAVCVIFLYISYVLPVAAGCLAHGRSWTRMGPWQLGRWYRPLAIVAVLGSVFIIVIGMQPPNQQAVRLVGGAVVLLVLVWFGVERKRFKGPPGLGVRGADPRGGLDPAELARGRSEGPEEG